MRPGGDRRARAVAALAAVLVLAEHVRALTVGELSVGAACPDDPESICVSLG